MNPLKIGLVGTGYAAKVRAEALQADSRACLVAVAGHRTEKTEAFSQTFGVEAIESWAGLVERPDLDVVIISNVNREHGKVAHAALQAGKHVIVDYPLALDVSEAEALIALSKAQGKLLHVEHIELLSSIHQALKQALPAIGSVFHVRYASVNPQRPAPKKWTYQPALFGFPLVGAISRLHRLVDLFGQVATVSCQTRYWSSEGGFSNQSEFDTYTTCLCIAQLRFVSGLLAEVVYGKGEMLWQEERTLEIQGEKGAIIFEGEQGRLVQADQTIPLESGSRRGLFAKDTAIVLDHLLSGTPLYVSSEASLYTLRVADAARRSAETSQTVHLENLESS